MSGRRTHGSSRTRAGVIAAVILALATYLTFAAVPYQHHHEIRVLFRAAPKLSKGTAVRVAGIDVGEVSRVEAGPGPTSMVVLRITKRGLVVHRDAVVAIAPRLALEGNYYLDLRLGTPGARVLPNNATLPTTQSIAPVQLDEVLDVFNRPVRNAFKASAKALAIGLSGFPDHASGAAGLQQATRELDKALGSIHQFADAAQGTNPGDLTRGIVGTGRLAHQLGAAPRDLANLVTNFDRTMRAIDADTGATRATVSEAAKLLRTAPAHLRRVDAVLPRLTSFSHSLRSPIVKARSSLRPVNAMLAQLNLLLRPAALPALVSELNPVTQTLPGLNARVALLMPWLTNVTDCVTYPIVPTLKTPIHDGANTSGQPPWLEFMHVGANLASTAANSDGNGTTFRLGITESETALRGSVPGLGQVLGTGDLNGVSPTWLGLGKQPPMRPDAACRDQQAPNLDLRRGQSGFTSGPAPKPTAQSRGMSLLMRTLLGSGGRNDLRKILLGLPSVVSARSIDRKLLHAAEPPRKRGLVKPSGPVKKARIPATLEPRPATNPAGSGGSRLPEVPGQALQGITRILKGLLGPPR